MESGEKDNMHDQPEAQTEPLLRQFLTIYQQHLEDGAEPVAVGEIPILNSSGRVFLGIQLQLPPKTPKGE